MDDQQPPDVREAGQRPAPSPDDESIRLWARANGYLVNDRGRIPAMFREAYAKARPGTLDSAAT